MPEKGIESNETATPKTSLPTKEQAKARINKEQSLVSAEDTIETSDQQEVDDSFMQRKYCLESCKYENRDESYDMMLTCICDSWYHLTCTNFTQETAQELSAWICYQCKANVGSVDF